MVLSLVKMRVKRVKRFAKKGMSLEQQQEDLDDVDGLMQLR